MPSLVQGIVKSQIKHISDNDLNIMIQDCDYQRKFDLYGDERIDKPGWLSWEQFLKDEKEKRNELNKKEPESLTHSEKWCR